MKKQLVMVGIVIILFVVSFSGCEESGNEDNNESGFYTYENIENGISIEYPATWNKYENPPQVPNVLILFISPTDEPTKTGSLMITVMNNVSLTMDAFKEAHIENLSLLIPDFTIIFEDFTTLADLPAYKIIFTFTNDIYIWTQLEIWTISENTLYLLVHQADQACYEDFTDDIEHMIESFRIIDTNGQDGRSGNSDFDKLVGTRTTETLVLLEGEAASTFEYSLSNDDNTLTLTNMADGTTTVLTKQ